jgi:hypothetical protein
MSDILSRGFSASRGSRVTLAMLSVLVFLLGALAMPSLAIACPTPTPQLCTYAPYQAHPCSRTPEAQAVCNGQNFQEELEEEVIDITQALQPRELTGDSTGDETRFVSGGDSADGATLGEVSEMRNRSLGSATVTGGTQLISTRMEKLWVRESRDLLAALNAGQLPLPPLVRGGLGGPTKGGLGAGVPRYSVAERAGNFHEWEANGSYVDSCDEYVYHKYLEYHLFEFMAAQLGGDKGAMFDRAHDCESDPVGIACRNDAHSLCGSGAAEGNRLLSSECRAVGEPMENENETFPKNALFELKLFPGYPNGIRLSDPALAAVIRLIQGAGQRYYVGGWQWHREMAEALEGIENEILYSFDDLKGEILSLAQELENETDAQARDSLNRQIEELLVIALEKGCFNIAGPEACDWSPALFGQQLSDMVHASREADYARCIDMVRHPEWFSHSWHRDLHYALTNEDQQSASAFENWMDGFEPWLRQGGMREALQSAGALDTNGEAVQGLEVAEQTQKGNKYFGLDYGWNKGVSAGIAKGMGFKAEDFGDDLTEAICTGDNERAEDEVWKMKRWGDFLQSLEPQAWAKAWLDPILFGQENKHHLVSFEAKAGASAGGFNRRTGESCLSSGSCDEDGASYVYAAATLKISGDSIYTYPDQNPRYTPPSKPAFSKTIVVGPIPITIEAGLGGSLGVDFATNEASRAHGDYVEAITDGDVQLAFTVTPKARFTAFVSVGVGISLVQIGLRGEVLILGMALPTQVALDLGLTHTEIFADFGIADEILSGKVDLFVKAGWFPFEKTFKRTLFSWRGKERQGSLGSADFILPWAASAVGGLSGLCLHYWHSQS